MDRNILILIAAMVIVVVGDNYGVFDEADATKTMTETELLDFHKTNIRSVVEDNSRTYPIDAVRSQIAECRSVLEGAGMGYLPYWASYPTHRYAAAIYRDGFPYMYWSVAEVSDELDTLSPETYRDFIALVYMHECFHLRGMLDGTTPRDFMDDTDRLLEESRVWWLTMDQVFKPMIMEARLQESIDYGSDVGFSVYLYCSKRAQIGNDCMLWQQFIMSVHNEPGARPLNEIDNEVLTSLSSATE